MDIKKDYRKFALSQGLHSSQIDAQEKKQVTDMVGTPMILEERQMKNMNKYVCAESLAGVHTHTHTHR